MYYKKLVLLTVFNTTNNISTLWGSIFPYVASYHRLSNSLISQKFFFSASVFILLGPAVMNIFLQYSYRLIGIRKTVLIGSFLYLLNCMSFCMHPSLFWAMFSIFFAGANYQTIILSTNLFFFEKYPQKAKSSVSLAISGGMIGNLLWGLLLNLLVNPENKKMTLTYPEQKGELFFEETVSSRISGYLLYNGIFAVIVTVIVYCLIEDPKNKKESVEDSRKESCSLKKQSVHGYLAIYCIMVYLP